MHFPTPAESDISVFPHNGIVTDNLKNLLKFSRQILLTIGGMGYHCKDLPFVDRIFLSLAPYALAVSKRGFSLNSK
jgi:hypothetical protein